MKTALLLSLLLPLTIIAQDAQPKVNRPAPEALLKRLDANNDGKLSREEIPEDRRQNFARQDANSDGFVSLDELTTFIQGQNRTPTTGRAPFPDSVIAKRDIPYANTENPRQKLDLYLPKDRKEGGKPLPLIVFIHGGGWKAGDKAAGAGNVLRFVTSGEYAAASVGYRLTNEAQWPAQIHDCKAAIRWLRANAKEHGCDPEKIAVWGSSAGGHLVSFLGTSGDVKELEGTLGSHTTTSSRVTCVLNYYGPENFISMVTQESTVDRNSKDNPEALLFGAPVREAPERAKEASPVTWISADDPPFMTAHGTKDPLVPYAQAMELDAALKKAGVRHLLIEMTGAGHGFRSEELDKRVRQFFDLHLRGIPAEISTEPIPAEARN
jgi:acetyl esterase/lipase